MKKKFADIRPGDRLSLAGGVVTVLGIDRPADRRHRAELVLKEADGSVRRRETDPWESFEVVQ